MVSILFTGVFAKVRGVNRIVYTVFIMVSNLFTCVFAKVSGVNKYVFTSIYTCFQPLTALRITVIISINCCFCCKQKVFA